MTMKRFTLIECNGNIEDGCTQIVYDGGEDVFELLDLLNSLNDENEQLKKDGLYWAQTAEARKKEIDRLQKENQSWLKTASHMDRVHHEDREYCERLYKENKDLREQLILANAFIKMIENCYEDASIEDILYMKYGVFQEELHLQMTIAKEELKE